MKNPQQEAKRWLAQAENDLEFARLALREKFYAQTCFICQQAAEKALKALRYRQGERLVIGHSTYRLIENLKAGYPQMAEFSEVAGVLDQFYVSSRYPNGLPDGLPFEVFNQKQAREALEGTEALIAKVRSLMDFANQKS